MGANIGAEGGATIAVRHRGMGWNGGIMLLLAVVWCFTGLSKALDVGWFGEVLRVHGVLPGWSVAAAAWAVPVAELGLGVMMAAGAVGGVRLGRAVMPVGMLMMMAIGGYVLLVPGAEFEAAGCGCFGREVGEQARRLVAGMEWGLKWVSVGVAGLLLVLHALAVRVREG